MNAWASLTLHGFDGRELFTVYARDIHEMVENIRKLGYKCAIEGDDCIVVDVGEVIFPAYMDPARDSFESEKLTTGDPKFYISRTKRAVNSLTVERGPKVGAE